MGEQKLFEKMIVKRDEEDNGQNNNHGLNHDKMKIENKQTNGSASHMNSNNISENYSHMNGNTTKRKNDLIKSETSISSDRGRRRGGSTPRRFKGESWMYKCGLEEVKYIRVIKIRII